MSAARLRRVGNRGHLIDPAKVAAVYRITRPHAVVVELESGTQLQVFWPDRINTPTERPRSATIEDVDKVWHQLTSRPS